MLNKVNVGQFVRLLMVSRHRANELKAKLGVAFDAMLGQAAGEIRRVTDQTDQNPIEAAIALGRAMSQSATLETRQTIELRRQMLIIAAIEEIETVGATDAPATHPTEPQR